MTATALNALCGRGLWGLAARNTPHSALAGSQRRFSRWGWSTSGGGGSGGHARLGAGLEPRFPLIDSGACLGAAVFFSTVFRKRKHLCFVRTSIFRKWKFPVISLSS